MNKFYTYPKALQWVVTLLLVCIFFAFMVIWTNLITKNFLYYFLIILFAPVMQFSLAPIFTLLGAYKYLSPMLLVYNPSAKKYDLHNGTGFDYFFVMRGVKKGRATQNTILAYYLQGLLKIIEELEEGLIPESITISGTSYFFSESTAKRLGFKIEKPSNFLKFNQYLNYIDLLWMYSRAKGKLTFPNLKEVKAATIQGGELLRQKAYLESMYNRLYSNLPQVAMNERK